LSPTLNQVTSTQVGYVEDGEATVVNSGDVMDYPNVDPDAEVITTATGLQYQEIEIGEGASAVAGQSVFVHYTGWLTDGTEFDSSVSRGVPIDFTLGVGRVIRGWDEGIEGMQVGGKRILIIPSDLGYGASGSPPVIPGGATLIFAVELVEIN
ncbi:MAG: FKBP-type peptidyl-prolyl cis-trans isomerase, partial [Chloroflexota bacterium]